MNDKVKQRLRDPKFHELSKEAKLIVLAKDDPDFGGLSPEAQNHIVDNSPKFSEALAPEPYKPPQKSFGEEFSDTFGPTALVKGAVNALENPPEPKRGPIPRNLDEAWEFTKQTVPGLAIAVGEGNKIKRNLEQAFKDYEGATDETGKYIAGAEGAIGSIPFLNTSMEAGRRMVPTDPNKPINWDASGALAGDLANAVLPKATGGVLQNLANKIPNKWGVKNIINILNPRQDSHEVPEAQSAADLLYDKVNRPSVSDRSFLQKILALKNQRLGQNKGIENLMAGEPLDLDAASKTLGPIEDFIKEQGDTPVFEGAKRATQGQKALEQANNFFFDNQPEQKGITLAHPSTPGTSTFRDRTFEDLLKYKQDAGTTARKGKAFNIDPEGQLEAEAAKSAFKGAQGTLEDLVDEFAARNPKVKPVFDKYRPNNQELRDLINAEDFTERQINPGTILGKVPMITGPHRLAGEIGRRIFGSTLVNSNIGLMKKQIASALKAQGLPEVTANALALTILRDQDATQERFQ